MKIRAITNFRHFGLRIIGDVWDEPEQVAKQLIVKGLAEEFTPEVDAARKTEAETSSKTKAKVKTNDKPADADGSKAAP